MNNENNGWQPIETAPKDGTAIFGLLPDGEVPHSIRFDNSKGKWMIIWDHFVLDGFSNKPTHWMPIPPLIKHIIEYGGYASRSLDPVGQLERFAERIQDEVARINEPKDAPKKKKQVGELIEKC